MYVGSPSVLGLCKAPQYVEKCVYVWMYVFKAPGAYISTFQFFPTDA